MGEVFPGKSVPCTPSGTSRILRSLAEREIARVFEERLWNAGQLRRISFSGRSPFAVKGPVLTIYILSKPDVRQRSRNNGLHLE